ncbi:MAG: purine-binding chemotaxis protein CheW [Planctomycetia bacterium]|nr:purine-binding chemotaxis protein CheW [Planctomycetia bacterium]
MSTPSTAAPQLFCTFFLGAKRFGIRVLEVREINRETTLTPVPHAPSEVRGCANLRGQVHVVLDIAKLLGLDGTALGPDSRLVILKPTVAEACGILVESIGDIVELDADAVEPWRPEQHGAQPGGDLIAGIGKLDDGLLVILNASRLLPAVDRTLARGG